MSRRTLIIGVVLLATLAARAVNRWERNRSANTPPPGEVVGEQPGTVVLSMLLHNHGNEPDVLLGGSTEIAESIQPRITEIVDGRRRDRLAPEGIPIPAGATLILEPGGDHLALVGLREDLIQGREFSVTLRFQQAGEVEVTGRVRRKIDAAGATPPPSVSAGEIDIWLVSAPPAPAYSTAK